MDSLPKEILYHIFLFLPKLQMTGPVKVCKLWSILLNDLYFWQYIFRKVYGGNLIPRFTMVEVRDKCLDLEKEIIKRFQNADVFEEVAANELCWASRHGYHKLAKRLLQNWGGRIVNQWITQTETNQLASPLFLAAQQGHPKVIKVLIANKVHINACTQDTKATPFWMACQQGHVEVVKLLLVHKADINTPRISGSTPLFIACANHHTAVVEILLQNGCDVNRANKEDATPLYAACRYGHPEIVQLLLQHGSNVNLRFRKGKLSPLSIAAQTNAPQTPSNNVEVVKLLLQHKAPIHDLDENGLTPVFKAASNGKTEVVETLLSQGANINFIDEQRNTPLILACQKGHVGVVSTLLNYGANINAINDQSMTPLHTAVSQSKEEVVSLLIERGADINLRNLQGFTALELAKQSASEKIINLLSANQNKKTEC